MALARVWIVPGGGGGELKQFHGVAGADVAEGGVDGVGEGVDLRGEVRAGDDDAASAVREEVGGAGVEPRVLVFEIESGGERGECIGLGDTDVERGDEGQHVAAGKAQAVVGHGAGERERALDGVEAVHRVVAFLDFATLGEFAGIVERAGLGVEKVGVDGDDARGFGKLVAGFDVGVAERGLRGGGRWFVLNGFVFGPGGSGEFFAQRGNEAGAGG